MWRSLGERGSTRDRRIADRDPLAGTGKRCLNFRKRIENGAGEEIRTLDPNLGKVVLYH
jgi:hypothetical protein